MVSKSPLLLVKFIIWYWLVPHYTLVISACGRPVPAMVLISVLPSSLGTPQVRVRIAGDYLYSVPTETLRLNPDESLNTNKSTLAVRKVEMLGPAAISR